MTVVVIARQLQPQSDLNSNTFPFLLVPLKRQSAVASKPRLYPLLQITEPESKHLGRYVSFPV